MCTTELKIARLLLPDKSVVPIRLMDLNPLSELTRLVLTRRSILIRSTLENTSMIDLGIKFLLRIGHRPPLLFVR